MCPSPRPHRFIFLSLSRKTGENGKEEVVELELTGGWTVYGGAFAKPRARKINGTVFLEGLVKHATSNGSSAITTLPEGFRPKSGRRIFAANQNGNAICARVDVLVDGRVYVYVKPATHRWVPLDNIIYRL